MHLALPVLLTSSLLTRLALASAMSSRPAKLARSGSDMKRNPEYVRLDYSTLTLNPRLSGCTREQVASLPTPLAM